MSSGRGRVGHESGGSHNGFGQGHSQLRSYDSRTVRSGPASYAASNSHGQNPNTQPSNRNWNSRDGQKRRHDQAFEPQSAPAHKHFAPPSVPSFGFDLNQYATSTKPPQQPTQVNRVEKPRPKANLLGLTPCLDEESEGEDVDEEAKLALHTGSCPMPGLSFSHRGRTLSLKTPQDISEWIAERRRNFPTKAKADITAAKARDAREAQARARQAIKDQNEQRVVEKRQNLGEAHLRVLKKPKSEFSHGKPDKLQKQLEKAQRKVAELQALKNGAKTIRRPSLEQPKATAAVGGDVVYPASTESILDDASDTSSDDADTSSSVSSSEDSSDDDPDEDAPPQEIPSKQIVLVQEADVNDSQLKQRPVCRHYMRGGRCSRGTSCHFRHEMPDQITRPVLQRDAVQTNQSSTSSRKTLYQKVCGTFAASEAL